MYLHGNHLGSMTLLTDEAGAVVEKARYYPFGGYRQAPTANITDIGFTGHRQDNLGWENTGLIYMGARYYDPLLRRFISADTIVPEVPDEAETIAYNRFAYAHQNPVNLIDLTGHCTGRRDGIGNSPEEQACWAKVYTIANMWNDYWASRYGDLETFWKLAGLEVLDTEYWEMMLLAYNDSDVSRDALAANQSDFESPPFDWGDYVMLTGTMPGTLIAISFTVDQFGNIHVAIQWVTMPSYSIVAGDIAHVEPPGLFQFEELSQDEQEQILAELLSGWGAGLDASFVGSLGIAIPLGDRLDYVRLEPGVGSPGLAGNVGYTLLRIPRAWLPW